MVSNPSLFMLLGILSQVLRISCYFDSLPRDSDVFQNPTCEGSALSSNACECNTFNAECVSSNCRVCKCRKNTRIYRSDVRKCLSDIEARDPYDVTVDCLPRYGVYKHVGGTHLASEVTPNNRVNGRFSNEIQLANEAYTGCRYQFLNTRADIIPTIDLSKICPDTKCSKPINAPFDKTKHKCRFSWVNFLENGTWHEESVRKFRDAFHLQSSDYFSDRGYMYSLEWKGSKQFHIRKRLFQVSLECFDRDNMKESYCLMFRVRGKNNPILLSGAEIRQKTTQPQTTQARSTHDFADKPKHTAKPTRFRDNNRREDSSKAKIVVVNDNFAVILAAIAGALGTALIIIPIAIFCRRTSRRRDSMAIRTHSSNSDRPSTSFGEEIELEPQTSEETLSSYTSLKPNRDPPPIYQPLIKQDDESPDEEPIYISVSGDEGEEEEPVKPPPIYHVLEDLRSKESGKGMNDE